MSGFLSASELADFRGVSDSALPDSCVIGTASWAENAIGGGTETFTPSGTVACRLAPGGLSPAERAMGERLTVVGDYVITMPASTIVPHSSRITTLGRTFEVVDAKHRSDEIALRVAVREVT